MKRWYVFLFMMCAIFLYRLWLPGFPYTHDGENHLARIANYAVALRQGQFPPRWAPSFWSGYGYPVFNYNYPLVNIAALPFLAIKIPTEITLKIIVSFSVVLSVIALWEMLHKRVTSCSATVGVLVWLFAPFTYTNLYVRGAVGEIAAYASALSVVWMIDVWREKRSKFAALWVFVSMFALMLAHNIITMLLLPIIMGWLIFLYWKKPFDRMLFGVMGLAMGASIFFWIPALFEKHLVNVDTSQVLKEYVLHLPTLSQLVFAPVQFGYSFIGPVDSLSYQVGISFFVSCAIAVLMMKTLRKDRFFSLVIGILGFGSVLMLSQYASPVWERITILRYVQFPWRMLGFLALFGGVISAWVMEKMSIVLQKIMLITLCVSFVQFLRFPFSPRFTHEDFYYKTYPLTSTILDEDKPKTLHLAIAELSSHMPHIESGVTFTQKYWNGSQRVYTVKSEKDHTIIEPTTFFPGWKTFIDEQEVVIDEKRAKGLITFDVPAGTHTIETRFTQDTVPRKIGNTISLISFMFFALVVLRWRRA